MKSHGPYKVYDHSNPKRTGNKIKEINDLAQKRFQEELKSIKSLRDLERNQFYEGKQF